MTVRSCIVCDVSVKYDKNKLETVTSYLATLSWNHINPSSAKVFATVTTVRMKATGVAVPVRAKQGLSAVARNHIRLASRTLLSLFGALIGCGIANNT